MGLSQAELNQAILYKHKLCDRILELITDIKVLDKSILLGISKENLIELGKLVAPAHEKIKEMRKKSATFSKELDKKIGK